MQSIISVKVMSRLKLLSFTSLISITITEAIPTIKLVKRVIKIIDEVIIVHI